LLTKKVNSAQASAVRKICPRRQKRRKSLGHCYLNDGLGAGDLENLPGPVAAIGELQVDDFGEFWELDIIQNDQGTVDTRHRSVSDPRLRNVVPEKIMRLNIRFLYKLLLEDMRLNSIGQNLGKLIFLSLVQHFTEAELL